MVALPLMRRKFTVDEYIMIERGGETRSEFLDGEIYAMAGATLPHVTIGNNLTVAVGVRIKGTNCQGMSYDMKVSAGAGRLYAYPDYLIVCGEPQFRDDQTDILNNPSVIFEILSPSTEQYDRVTKFDIYKMVDSLREYVLIAQDTPRVEHFARLSDGSWSENVLVGLGVELSLETVAVNVALRDLYDRVTFPEVRE